MATICKLMYLRTNSREVVIDGKTIMTSVKLDLLILIVKI